MESTTPTRNKFTFSFLHRVLQRPLWQRILFVAFLLVAYSLYFIYSRPEIGSASIAITISIVTISTLLLSLGGGILVALFIPALQTWILIRYFPDGLLLKLSGELLINTFNLTLSAVLVGLTRIIMLRSLREAETQARSNQALQESELRFRTVADLTYNWEAWQDPEGLLIYMSPSVERITGYPPKAFFENPNLLMQLTVEDDRPALEAHFAITEGENPLGQVDIRIRHADGRILWLRHICQPVYDAQGQFLGRRASNLDITEIRQANEELKRRLGLEHLLSEISGHFIEASDTDIEKILDTSLKQVGEFVHAERVFLLIFATDSLVIQKVHYWTQDGSKIAGKMVGVDFSEFPRVLEHIRENKVLQTKNIQELIPPAYTGLGPFVFPEKTAMLAIPLVLENTPLGIFGFSSQVQERTWREEDIRSLHLLSEIYTNMLGRQRIHHQLINSELRFRSTFENAGIGITMVNKDTIILNANPRMCQMFGYEREELIGLSTDQITLPEDRPLAHAVVEELLNKRTSSLQREIRYTRKDGRMFWGRLTTSLVLNQQGTPTYGIGMVEDITDQRQISQELQRRERILEAVSLAAEDLLRVPDWESGVQRALAALGSASQANHVSIYQLEDETAQNYILRLTAAWSREEDGLPLVTDWINMLVHAEKDSLLVRTFLDNHLFNGVTSQFPEVMANQMAAINISSVLLVPINVEGRFWGVISYDSDRASIWSSAEEEGLRISADIFGAAFQRQQVEKQIEQLYQSEHDQRQMAEALRDSAEALNASLNLEEVFDQVLENMGKVVPLDAANVMLIDNGEIQVVGTRGYAERGDLSKIMNVRYRIDEFPSLDFMYHTGMPVVLPSVSESADWISDANFPWIASYAGAPIRQHGRTVGFLNAHSVTPDLFNQAHADRLQVFANQASLAIRNASLFDETRQRVQQIALLNQMAEVAISASTQPEMLTPMIHHLAALFEADSAAILLFDPSEQDPTVAATIGETTSLNGQFSNADLAGFALLEKPLEIEDLSLRPDVKSAAALLHPCRALLALPMVLDGSHLGTALVGFKKTRRIISAEVTLGEQAALQIALGISKIQLLESERTRTRQLARANNLFTALEHVATRISAAADSSGVINTLETELKQLDLSYAIALSDSSTGEMLLQYYSFHNHSDWRGRHDQIAHLFDREEFKHPVFNEQNLFYIPDPMRQVYSATAGSLDAVTARELVRLAGFNEHSHMFLLPLIVKERAIGLLAVWGSLQESDRTVMSIFASQLAVAFYNASLYEEIQRVAITDDMTGLFNRRGMHEFGEREVERARRFNRPLSALMLDLDLFSRVNNTYGHLVGDEVLRLLAERVRSNIRELDVAVRFGGEEFLILLVETSLADAQRIAERIRQSVAGAPFETSAGALRITASVGVAEMTSDMSGITHLIARADQALYGAKQTGRNRVSVE